ncbi:hypothetical protein [Nostoc sp.]|uniref:hypothetical protein n=1 Tax=Nostoc sp. TaxID=1180 RepID=UPI002FF5E23E
MINNVVVSGQPHQQLLQQLDLMIRARYPLLYIVSVEEEPVEQVLHQLTQTPSHLVSFYFGIL